MESMRAGQGGLHPRWWTLIMFATIAGLVLVTCSLFAGSFSTFMPVILTSDRSGLVMETGSKVKMRGIEVGRVSHINAGNNQVRLQLDIFPAQVQYIPANVGARIRATTAFGAKYVDLIYPQRPSSQRLFSGQSLKSENVSTEVNTVFQNLVGILQKVDSSKLNAVLSAFADGVRGRGEAMGQAITAANHILPELNTRQHVIRSDFQALKGFSDTYAWAADDIIGLLDAASVTSTTITDNAKSLDALLLSTTGFANSGIELLAPIQDNLVNGINGLLPTTDLLLKYNPQFACMILGAEFYHEHGSEAIGGNGRSVQLDGGLLFGDDPYVYPDNLPIVAATGGPGGQPGCGSLPIVDNNWPQRYLVTNTGWGTGLDLRPNPGIGHPFYVDYLPVTRGTPEPPFFRGEGPVAPGPIPYPGGPPYGAPLYGPDGTPLYPGVPPPPSP